MPKGGLILRGVILREAWAYKLMSVLILRGGLILAQR